VTTGDVLAKIDCGIGATQFGGEANIVKTPFKASKKPTNNANN